MMTRSLLLPFLALLAVLGAAPASRSGTPPAAAPAANRTWLGKWIWTPGETSPRNSYTYFRKALTLDAPQKEARIHLTADSRYQLFVNGKFIGRGPVRSDRRWLYYDTWDLASHLKKGKNVLAVLVHHYGEYTFQYMHGRGGLIAEATGAAGRALARTDGSWKALRAEAWATGQPRMSIQLGFNEIFDARKEAAGWKTADFEDAAWPAAVEIGPAGMEPWPHLVARDIPPMLEEGMTAKKVLEVAQVDPAAGAQHVDLLAQMPVKEWAVAYLTTTLISPDRREVDLRFGSDDALKVWLNGKLIASHPADRAAAPSASAARGESIARRSVRPRASPPRRAVRPASRAG